MMIGKEMTNDEIEKAEALSNWWAKVAENKNGWKIRLSNNKVVEGDQAPTMLSDLSRFPINDPIEGKIIDLSVIVKTGIDVEVRDFGHSWQLKEHLCSIKPDLDYSYYVDNDNNSYKCCRPRMNYWYAHDQNEESPIPAGFFIEVYRLAGNGSVRYGRNFSYYKEFDWSKVARYRILEKLPEYKYAWEQEK